MSRAGVVAVAILTLSAVGGPARPAAAESPIRVESRIDRASSGAPWVTGHVYNDYGRPVARVQVRIEALDASGVTTATATTVLGETILGYARVPFSVKAPAPASAYRVIVVAFDWDTHLCT